MKRILVGLLAVASFGLATEVYAQDNSDLYNKDWTELTKKERKAIKKELKGLDEAEYFDLRQSIISMTTDLESLRATISGKDQQISTLMQEKNQVDDRIATLEAELAEARRELAARPAQPVQTAEPAPDNRTRVTRGVVFRVQIGAFRQKDLSKYFDNHPNFAGEITEDGTQQITLGEFRDYWQADQFKKYLREMGVKDAWIVPYKDGQRVAIKDVLEGVI